MTTTARPNYRFVNKKQPRLEGIAKVTGRTQYTADVKLPRLSHMKLLTAPHAHAIIKKLDTTRAKAYPGVVGVFTADDLPAHLQRDGALVVRFLEKQGRLEPGVELSRGIAERLRRSGQVFPGERGAVHVVHQVLEVGEFLQRVRNPRLEKPFGRDEFAALFAAVTSGARR